MPLRSERTLRSHFGSRSFKARVLTFALQLQLLLHLSPTMDMMGGMKEAAKKQIEEQMGEAAPGYIKPCFACCGGPVGTLDKFIFVVPKDQQETVKSAIEKYKSL
uniref:Uncharacterized protein n=1 Tax=Prorocentrum micans TaxID=2945 RepID=A0A7S2TBH8_PROMC|mmetsp:Transcript_16281/g.13101  ORF Transcript_16281/g.13101 Transcript_16281/m.13101 type:complete len:105 (+) Transcript_16281:32-346(+)